MFTELSEISLALEANVNMGNEMPALSTYGTVCTLKFERTKQVNKYRCLKSVRVFNENKQNTVVYKAKPGFLLLLLTSWD